MPKLELLKSEIDTTKVYHPKDNFLFKLTFNNQEPLDDDVEFEVIHYGDSWSDDHDQKLCHNIIGPLDAGKLYFELDTAPIDLTKVPVKTLFGLTSLVIVGKFRGMQFIRIGYVVDVRYPGIETEKLADSEDEAGEETEEDESVESESGDEEEIVDDGEVDDEDEEVDGEEVELDDEEVDGEEVELDDEEIDDNDIEIDDEEDDDIEVGNDGEVELHDSLAEAIFPTSLHRSIPLETPITADKDEFEYKGYSMKKSLIEMSLLDKPIVHVFDIDWEANEGKDMAESTDSKEEEAGEAETGIKKVKTQ